jgi:hypothetical protein
VAVCNLQHRHTNLPETALFILLGYATVECLFFATKTIKQATNLASPKKEFWATCFVSLKCQLFLQPMHIKYYSYFFTVITLILNIKVSGLFRAYIERDFSYSRPEDWRFF